MALDVAAFNDLQNYIKRRVGSLKYQVGDATYDASIIDAQILPSGIVRVQAQITPNGPAVIRRVELYSTNGELWAHQDINITINQGQTGVLYWFDFIIKEEDQ